MTTYKLPISHIMWDYKLDFAKLKDVKLVNNELLIEVEDGFT